MNERELSRQGFMSWTTVGSLDIDWDTMSMSTSELRGFLHAHLEKGMAGEFWPLPRCLPPTLTTELLTDTCEDDSVPEIRFFFKNTSPNTKARIFGHKQSDQCIIVSLEHRRYLGYVITGVSLSIS